MKLTMLVAVAVLIASTSAVAAPCRDEKGHFAKCPKPAAGPIRCKDAKGKYAKCGLPGTHPVDR